MRRKLLIKAFILAACLLSTLSAVAAEAYANYTEWSSTLTFYYDSYRDTRTGETYSLNWGSNDPAWSGISGSVNTVVFDPSFAGSRRGSTYKWFYGMQNLTSVMGLQYLNTSEVTTMGYMFSGCSALTSLDVSNFNTAAVTDMRCLFQDCSALTSLDLSNFNTAAVTDMFRMFSGCTNLATIYVSVKWQTTGLSYSANLMFASCYSLVGGMGTPYDDDQAGRTYAHSDGGSVNPGYLTAVTEPYAVYSPGNTTLTFYNDNQVGLHPGTSSDLLLMRWRDYSASITNVVFDPSFAVTRPTTTKDWFRGMSSLNTITGMKEYLNTTEVTDMTRMFCDCSSLTSLDLNGFNTSNVTLMDSLFWCCSSLTNLDLSSFNTSKLTSMRFMFWCCSSLTDLDLRSFNTANVETMRYMFAGCRSLTSLNLDSFNTANVVNMEQMFSGCRSLTALELGSFDTGKLQWASSMFEDCGNLVTIYVDGDKWKQPYYGASMFYMCHEIRGFKGTTYDYHHVDEGYAHIDGGPSNPGYLSPKRNAYALYTSENQTLTFYYDALHKWYENGYYSLPTSGYPGWYNNGTYANVTHVVFDPSFADARPTSTFSWFYGMTNLQSITGMEYLNTSEVTRMSQMFGRCSSLTSIDVSHFNTDRVTEMHSMFNGCSSLTSLDLSNFNTAGVTELLQMFRGCSALTSLDVSSFNTANVTDMKSMFYGCSGLTSLDLKSFNTSKVTTMQYMFNGCSGLSVLDLRTFNTARVTDMLNMFNGCSSLVTIYVGSGWSTSGLTSPNSMFGGCTNLVGGQGTTFDSGHKTSEYAHIDGGPSNPGYLTELKEAYVCYTPGNTTITFYYDAQRSSRPGTIYDLDDEYNIFNLPGWIVDWIDMETNFHPATRVVFDPSFADVRPTSTSYWFLGLGNVQNISGINYLNTAEVTNMTGMFNGCSSLTSLDLSGFNTANVTYMEGMFRKCSGLTSLDLSSFNTSNVGDMSSMFEGCTGLTSLDLSSFNTAQAAFIPYMFNGCSNLTTIYVGSEWNLPANAYSEYMFDGCTSLVGGQGTTYDENHVDAAYAHIDGGPSNPGYLTDPNVQPEPEAYASFTSSDSTLTFYYDSRRASRPGTTYDLNSGVDRPGWYTDGTNASVTQVAFDASFAGARPTSTFGWFDGMQDLQSISGMNILNTSEVTRMDRMFIGCSSLTSLDVSNFNTSNVTGMGNMFNGCSSLTSLDVSGFNTSNVITMFYMFLGCSGLTSLDVSSFNTSNVTDMTGMFGNCRSLASLDLSSFNTSNVTGMYFMFGNCTNLTTIHVGSGWSTAAVTSSNSMFQNCIRLVGGQGTTFDASHINAAYAHIDGGPSNPGYFTAVAGSGDVNGDGEINISDVILLNNLLSNGGELPANGDVNGDGQINISDVIKMINYVSTGQW